MDTNGAPNSANAAGPRTTPSTTTPTTQSSIRSFFQPRAPTYTAPPPASTPSPTLPQYQKPPPASSRQTPNTQAPKATSDTSSTLPPRASISPIQEQHIQPLRRINSLLLPIAYPDNFYHKILTPDNFSRVLLWTETYTPPASSTFSASTTRIPTVIGGIVCRVDASPSDPRTSDIYVQSLALLSPYRGQGLATSLLNSVITSAISQQADTKIVSLYAHVWTENTEALEWYAARGFKREEPILHGYYRRLKPDTAWLIRRRLSPTDHLQNQPHLSSLQTRPSSPAQTGTPPIPRCTASSPANGTDSPLSPTRPSLPHTASFQDRRPEREWNDLPSDLGLLGVPSTASSRSSSTSRDAGGKKKKERKYPPAAFGA